MKHFQNFWNIMLATDSYKASHWNMLPKGLTYTESYCEARGGAFPVTVFFGLQYYIESYLVGEQVTEEKIQEAKEFYTQHFGLDNVFNEAGWRYILEKCDGKLPIKIEAVKEGSIVPIKNLLFKISNTDPNCAWLVNWCETLIMKCWYPITISTNSMLGKEFLTYHMEKSGTSNMQDWMLHDFSYRGVASEEQAWLGGAAHLLSFKGTDNVAGVRMLMKYYNAPMCGFSVNASEHMVMTINGSDKEKDTYRRLLKKFSKGILSLVSDQYDIYAVCKFLSEDTELKELILNRDGKLVIRPDCYDDKTEILTNNGWKFFNDLLETDLVAQWDNYNLSFVKPTKIINQKYKGKMINIKSEHFKTDLLVTPNHRMLKINIYKNNKIHIQEAQDIKYYEGFVNPQTGKYINDSILKSKLTAYEKLLIAYNADGIVKDLDKERPNNGKYIMEFGFAQQRKIDKLISICKEGNFDYKIGSLTSRQYNNENKQQKDQQSIYVYLENKPFKNLFEWVKINEIDNIWCAEFIDEVKHWDSIVRDEFRINFSSTIKENVKSVQTIATLAGYKTIFVSYTDDRSEKFNDSYLVYITKNKMDIACGAFKKQEIDYDGTIHCVTVPSGMIMVKRNDNIIISGNSGEPRDVLEKCLNILADGFGFTTNSKGYKVLNSKIGLLQGDGITVETMHSIITYLEFKGWSVDNLVFGSGGGLLQKFDRDTLQFAIKCSYAVINDIDIDVYKDPITSKGSKKSKRGQLYSIWDEKNGYQTINKHELAGNEFAFNMLQTVFENGEASNIQTYDQIQETIKIDMKHMDDLIIKKKESIL